MNLVGLGTDIIEIERIRRALEKHADRFLTRLFTAKEQAYCLSFADSSPALAGRFAAKEALLKALGTGLTREILWTDIEIVNDSAGKPEVHLSERLRRQFPTARFLVSISHCRTYATATALYFV